MGQVKNILFIMFDQLRWDYLSCAGHPHLHTPNIDALAEVILRAPIANRLCGASRMSFYTGTLLSFPWGHMEPCPPKGW